MTNMSWMIVAVTLGVAGATTLPPVFGALNDYALVAASTMTNSGNSHITGNIALFPGTAVAGFGEASVSGSTQLGTPNAQAAQEAATAMYNDLASRACLYHQVALSGATLAPGVYCYGSSVGLVGELFLDGQGQASPVWIFQIGSTLSTSTSAKITFKNGGKPCDVFWQVGSSATIETGTAFAGTIVALASISLSVGASNLGTMIARNGAITLLTNVVLKSDICGQAATTQTASTTTALNTTTTVPLTTTASAKTTTGTTAQTTTAARTTTAAPTTTTPKSTRTHKGGRHTEQPSFMKRT
jgi:hypothetical protein